MKKSGIFFIYTIIFFIYAIWSFALTDRNLILINSEPFVRFQYFMWSLKIEFVTVLYVLLVLGLFCIYTFFITQPQLLQDLTKKKSWLIYLAFVVLFSFSTNALSHDIFNYIFNAKMIVQYRADPHMHSAIEFSNDLWIRFMHNVHTPAPYFYGWTLLSLIPFLLGLGKFFTTYLVFKLWNVIALGVLLFTQLKTLQFMKVQEKWRIWLLALNPLLLIEGISNGHNDVWMMAFVFISFYCLEFWSEKRSTKNIVISLFFLAISISIKYVTIVLLPVWFLLLMRKEKRTMVVLPAWVQQIKLFGWIRRNPFDASAVLLLIPLLSSRSQWFHPWYLIWSLSFLPFIHSNWLRVLLLSLSFSSMLRYIPWIKNGAFEYTDELLVQQRIITWGVGLLISAVWIGWNQRRYLSKITS